MSKKNSNELKLMMRKINKADKIIVGIGAGMSASAGLDYCSESFFESNYPDFYHSGLKTIGQAVANNWYLTEENKRRYWGFWSQHINNIFYQVHPLETYQLLYDMIKDKNYFIITTNVDGQVEKSKLNPDRIFSMQGSYGDLQCQDSCHNKIYKNEKYIKRMLKSFSTKSLEVSESDIPRCPKCSGLLTPNLRRDKSFVEADSMSNRQAYNDFLSGEEEIIFLELGVGYNTPHVIRYPFEEMTWSFKNAYLIRVNLELAYESDLFNEKALIINKDIHSLLCDLKSER